jgi:hypothetical protein
MEVAQLRLAANREFVGVRFRFSITGAVCYSRQIEETLCTLMVKGMRVPKERDTVMIRDEAAEEIRARLRRTLPSSIYRSLQDTSKRFYGKMFKSR